MSNVVFLLLAEGMWMEEKVLTSCRAPFAGGMWYARQVIKQAGGERDDDPENASVRL